MRSLLSAACALGVLAVVPLAASNASAAPALKGSEISTKSDVELVGHKRHRHGHRHSRKRLHVHIGGGHKHHRKRRHHNH